MAYQLTVDHTARTIVITGTGTGSTADTLHLIHEHQQTFRDHAGYHLLYDSSRLDIESSPADMLKVATALFEAAPTTFGRIAVIVPVKREGLARMFAALAEPHGVKANVFTHLADARRWLGIEETAE